MNYSNDKKVKWVFILVFNVWLLLLLLLWNYSYYYYFGIILLFLLKSTCNYGLSVCHWKGWTLKTFYKRVTSSLRNEGQTNGRRTSIGQLECLVNALWMACESFECLVNGLWIFWMPYECIALYTISNY